MALLLRPSRRTKFKCRQNYNEFVPYLEAQNQVGWKAYFTARVKNGYRAPDAFYAWDKFGEHEDEVNKQVEERNTFLVRAGLMCAQLDKQQQVFTQMKEQYVSLHDTAAREITASACDFSHAKDAIDSMRKLEGGACGYQLYRTTVAPAMVVPQAGAPAPPPQASIGPEAAVEADACSHASSPTPPPSAPPATTPSEALRASLDKRMIECATIPAPPAPTGPAPQTNTPAAQDNRSCCLYSVDGEQRCANYLYRSGCVGWSGTYEEHKLCSNAGTGQKPKWSCQ